MAIKKVLCAVLTILIIVEIIYLIDLQGQVKQLKVKSLQMDNK